MSNPVSRASPRKASTIDPSVGCDVLPDRASIAASTQSTPAALAASVFHDDDIRIPDLKVQLDSAGIEVRL